MSMLCHGVKYFCCVLKQLQVYMAEQYIYIYIFLKTQERFKHIFKYNLSSLSTCTGNPQLHTSSLRKAASKACTGEPSLQNAMEVAIQSLR